MLTPEQFNRIALAISILVAVIGAVPLVSDLFDFCFFAPLFSAPLSEPKIRAGK